MKKEEIRQAVETSMNKVFGGNMRPNEGKIENTPPVPATSKD